MTRTRRIYNKHPIQGGLGFKGYIASQKRLLGVGDWWFYYHPYAQICVGHCPWCKKQWEQHVAERK